MRLIEVNKKKLLSVLVALMLPFFGASASYTQSLRISDIPLFLPNAPANVFVVMDTSVTESIPDLEAFSSALLLRVGSTNSITSIDFTDPEQTLRLGELSLPWSCSKAFVLFLINNTSDAAINGLINFISEVKKIQNPTLVYVVNFHPDFDPNAFDSDPAPDDTDPAPDDSDPAPDLILEIEDRSVDDFLMIVARAVVAENNRKVEGTTGTAGSISTNTTRLIDNTLIFQARFDSRDWSGELLAYPIGTDGQVIYEEDWNETVTGWVADIPTPENRNIFSWNPQLSSGSPIGGVVFDWSVDGSDESFVRNHLTENDVRWVQGYDIAGTRGRDTLLGDIVNSTPLVVGVPNFMYQYLPTNVGDTYGSDQYIQYRSKTDRPRMLYIGANDGMLHAFDAATGVEQFSYVPAGVYGHLSELTKTEPDYSHRFYVDGSPTIGDAYVDLDGLGPEWKTILVGTLGAGGRSVFALDVSDPKSFNKDNVLWEFGYAPGVDCVPGVKACKDVGYTFGQATLGLMQNNQWAVIFGNGYGSDAHTARLFIVNAATGTLIRSIDTGVGSAAEPNGLSTPAILPDSQRIITAAYAGDLRGNVWKFDLSNAAAGTWKVAYNASPPNQNVPAPLFRARNSSGHIQPITAPLEIGMHPSGVGRMIYFGTGKYFEIGDNIVGESPRMQTFYGIWDNGSSISETHRGNLVAQTITFEGTTLETNWRVVTNNSIAWGNTNNPTSRGWYIDLASPDIGSNGERVISAPLLRRGRVVFTTLIPSSNPCDVDGNSSWIMEVDALTGGRLNYTVLDINRDGSIKDTGDNSDLVNIGTEEDPNWVAASGIKSTVGIVSTPAVIQHGEVEYKYFGGTTGSIEVITELGSQDGGNFGRRSWRQLQCF